MATAAVFIAFSISVNHSLPGLILRSFQTSTRPAATSGVRCLCPPQAFSSATATRVLPPVAVSLNEPRGLSEINLRGFPRDCSRKKRRSAVQVDVGEKEGHGAALGD